MPLSLDDIRWNEVETSYRRGCDDLKRWLAEAYEPNGPTSELLGDIVNEVQHQGDTSTAMYLVAPHLIELSKSAEDSLKLAFLTCAGGIYAAAKRDDEDYDGCPAIAYDEFVAFAKRGAELIAPLLAVAETFSEFQWGVAALAGFRGENRFARLLEHLDDYEGAFHYALLDRPIPIEP